jgi:hypothetical protein
MAQVSMQIIIMAGQQTVIDETVTVNATASLDKVTLAHMFSKATDAILRKATEGL